MKIKSCDQCPIMQKHNEKYAGEVNEIERQLYLGRAAERTLNSVEANWLPLDEFSALCEQRNAKAELNARREKIKQELLDRCAIACPIGK